MAALTNIMGLRAFYMTWFGLSTVKAGEDLRVFKILKPRTTDHTVLCSGWFSPHS